MRDRSLFVDGGLRAFGANPPYEGQFIALRRFSSTLSRKPVVESHFWSAPTSSAKSLVMEPASTVSTHTFSRVEANLASGGLLSSLARWVSPRVQAKIEAMELVEVSWPFWCWR